MFAGVPVALGTDFNPNAHCLTMPFVMNLACVTMRMTMNEALVAATINSAGVCALPVCQCSSKHACSVFVLIATVFVKK